MDFVHQQISAQFHKWEERGRGWQIFKEPVSLEPPFRPFYGHHLPDDQAIDDGRRVTAIGSLVQRLSRKLRTDPEAPPVIPQPDEEPEPEPFTRDSLVELQATLPANLSITKEAFEQFLLNLSFLREPLAFELLGLPGSICAQFATAPDDSPLVRRQLQAYFPEAVFHVREGVLEQAWNLSGSDDALAIEFGLAREFMLPLASGKLDPFIGVVGALAELQQGEIGLYQVLFQPAQALWSDSITRSVTKEDGAAVFVNAHNLTDAAKNKIARPLYSVLMRILVTSQRQERTLQMARDLACSLRVFAHPQGNELIPLKNDEYPFENHIEDVIRRQSHRSGMLLNTDELIGFVHLPSSAVRSSILSREAGRTKPAPPIVRQETGVLLGTNIHAGQSVQVRLTPEQRVRHVHIVGASGTGKSTLLFNLIRQDIEAGQGVGVLDPHGDLVDMVLGIIPAHRVQDVVLVDPSDEQFSVGFNILSAHTDLEKNLLASDLVSVFHRLSTSWGDQMGSVLNNAILVFLENSHGGTIAELRRFLVEPLFRTEFLKTVNDPELIYYWQKGFPQLSGNKSIGPILTRLETFLAPKAIRYMVSQRENRLDFGDIMDTGKIFLAKLSQGLVGKENSFLLGTLLVSKFQQLAMARQAQRIASRRNFLLYIDEFHNFITPSMAEILTGARKYGVGLVLAHQELRQLQRDSEVCSAVMSNPYTRIVFRVGDEDARKLGEGFAFFEPRDLQNLETGKAIVRVERSDYDFNLSVPLPDEPKEFESNQRREEAIAASRQKYSLPRSEIETALRRAREMDQPHEQLAPDAITPEKPTQQEPEPPQPVPPPTPTPLPQIQPPAPQALDTKAAPPSEKAKPSRPADLGKGGAQHKAIQRRIKAAAEKLGFRGTIEKQLLDGQGSVDLLLERSDQTIACEISFSTTIDHEVGNVVKCLKAGFAKVAVICLDDERLKKIAKAVKGSLGPDSAGRVVYSAPDDFITQLQNLRPLAPAIPPKPEKRRGYTVKKSFSKLTPAEQKQREEFAIRSIAEVMRVKSK